MAKVIIFASNLHFRSFASEIKKKISKIGKFLLVFTLALGWIFSGWPQILNFPPTVQEVQATASGDGKIFYSISGDTTPRTRDYISSTNSFNAAVSTVVGGTALQSVLRASPIKDEMVAGYVNSAGTLQVMCWNGTSWSNEWSVAVGGTGTTRRFDIAYETNSGDVIVAYSTNAAATNAVNYRTKLGSAGCGGANWATAISMPTTTSLTTGVVHWVKAAWDKRTAQNLIAVIWADANADLGASIWSGTAFGNFPTLAQMDQSLEVVTAAQDVENFDVEYESLSGDVMVVWANSVGTATVNGAFFNTCTGGTATCTWGTRTAMPTVADDATHLDIAGDPISDRILYGAIGNAGADLTRGVWSGTAWTNSAGDTTCATPTAGTKFIAVGWLNNGATKRGVLVYYDSAATNVGWQTVDGTTWTGQTDWAPTPAFGVQSNYQIEIDPFNRDRLIFAVNDANADIFAKRLIMDAAGAFTWTNADGGVALEANTGSATSKTFDFAYYRYVPPTFGQAAYRLFNNLDSTDVGTALAAQDTPATLSSAGAAFRLRMLMRVDTTNLTLSGQSFHLQFATRSGTCDTGFSGETYADVTAVTAIAFNNNAAPADGAALTANANDPVDGARTISNQTYEELNPFTNVVSAITAGQTGKWDFALRDNGAPAGTSYCFRAVLATGAVINTYTVIPEITTFIEVTQTLTFSLGTSSLALGTLSTGSTAASSHTVAIATNAANGVVITYSGPTLTAGAHTITAMSVNAGSIIGTEQFGLNAVANTTPSVGAACSGSSPIASAATNYNTANSFRFVSGETIVSSTGAINSTTCTVSYIANIAGATEAGSYSTTLTYTATAQF